MFPIGIFKGQESSDFTNILGPKIPATVDTIHPYNYKIHRGPYKLVNLTKHVSLTIRSNAVNLIEV